MLDLLIHRHLSRIYGLQGVTLSRLGGADNTNYRVDGGGAPYALHVYPPGRSRREAAESELRWLEHLRAETRLVLPYPVKSLSGHLVTGFTDPDGTERLCTLMGWVEGRVPPTVTDMTDAQLAHTGAVMALLHRHTRTFSPPSGFTRERYDLLHFRKRLETLRRVFGDAGLETEGFTRDAERVLGRFSRIDPVPDAFGLIHADFHSGNYLIRENEVRVIDFGRCGFGFYAFDLALALMELGEAQRPLFLGGYEAVSPLPKGTDDLELFLCLAYLDNLGFLAENPGELPFVMGEFPLVAEALRRAAR